MKSFIYLAIIVCCLLIGLTQGVRTRGFSDSDSDEERISRKLDELNSKRKKVEESDVFNREDAKKWEQERKTYEQKSVLAAQSFGHFSEERATMLHKLGQALYKLTLYEDAKKISRDIHKIYEKLYGPEHTKTADALGNIASVSFRLKDLVLCRRVILRQLNIYLKAYGDGSKEVMLTRGRMATYGFEDAMSSQGTTHDEFQEEDEDDEL